MAGMNEWQSIETAPRDGTWILLCGGEIDYAWDGSDKPICVVAQYESDSADGGWQFAWYDGGYFGTYVNPTHWMPLPDLPVY